MFRSLAAAFALALLTAAPAVAQQPPLEHARALYDAGRLDEAAARLQAQVREGTRDPGVYLLLGVVERSAGRYESAIVALRQGWEIDPGSIPIAVELATTLAWNQRLNEAADLYGDVLRMDPGNQDARTGLGFVRAWQGRRGEAREIFASLTLEDPENVSAWTGLAFVERATLRRAAATAAYRRVLELDPGNPEALAALDALPWDRRGEARALAGIASHPGLAGRGEARAEALYALSPRLTVAGGFQRYAFGAASPLAGPGVVDDTRTEHSIEGGATYRPTERTALAASVYTFFSEESNRTVLWLEGVAGIAPRLSLVANVRPIFASQEPRTLLGGAAGAMVSLPGEQILTLRALIGGDTDYEPRTTLLANYDVAFSRRLHARAAAAHSGEDRFGFTSASVGATFLATPGLGFSAEATRRTGTAERSTFLAGLLFRF